MKGEDYEGFQGCDSKHIALRNRNFLPVVSAHHNSCEACEEYIKPDQELYQYQLSIPNQFAIVIGMQKR